MYLTNLLQRTASLWPSQPSAAHADGFFTWTQTLERVRKLSTVIAKHSPPYSAVAVLASSSHWYLELIFAVPMAGRTLVPMNTRLSVGELRTLLRQAGCSALFFDATHEHIADLLKEDLDCAFLYLSDDSDETPAYALSAAMSMADAFEGDQVALDREDIWAIIFTGGTTGLPKGVRLSHRALEANLECILRDLDWGNQPRFLQVTPMFHMAGLGTSYAATAWGGQQSFLPRFSIEELIDRLARERITAVNLVPTMIAKMLAHPELNRVDLSSLVNVSYGASAIALPTLRAMLSRWPGLRLTQFYGQTEAGGHFTALRPDEHVLEGRSAERLRSAGRPTIGAWAAILDANGQRVESGTWGEICVRVESFFSGYLGHPELSGETVRDGWLHTGDVGYQDEDGFVFITDRLKDMVVSGGENISSREVEDVVLQHPLVVEAAVVACPDPLWGERVHAVVVVRAGAILSEAELVAFCRGRIADYKCPKSCTIRHEPLPLSAIGKVKKDVLRAELSALGTRQPPVSHTSSARPQSERGNAG